MFINWFIDCPKTTVKSEELVIKAMSDLDNLMAGSVPSAPQLGQPSAEPVATVVDGPLSSAVNPYARQPILSCETMVYNITNSHLMPLLVADTDEDPTGSQTNSLANRQSTELTFSDLTPPVPTLSTLESNRILNVDTSLPTVDGVSDAVPEPKSMLIQQVC